MTEVEQFVRDRVAATGEPCLMVALGGPPSLRALLMSEEFMDGTHGVYILLGPWRPPASWDDLHSWESEPARALSIIRRWVPTPPEGVDYVEQQSVCDVERHVQASVLGLSLLQLALNRAGSEIAIEVRT